MSRHASAVLLWAALVGLAAEAHGPTRAPSRLGPKRAQVRRVVTLAPSLTETVEALGAGGLLVGVSRFDTGEAVAALPRVGGFLDPSIEAVISLRPDLVLVQPSPGNRRAVEKLAQLGAPIVLLPMHTVAETAASILAVGEALGRRTQAEGLLARFEQRRAELRGKAARLGRPRVLLVYGFKPLVVAGRSSFAGELLEDIGAVNAAGETRAPFPIYSVEKALSLSPQVVVDVATSRMGQSATQSLPGLESARWVRAPSDALMHPGPRMIRALDELFVLVHGG